MEKDNGCYLYLKCKYYPSDQEKKCSFFYSSNDISFIDIHGKKFTYCDYYSDIFSKGETRCLNKKANKQALLNILNGNDDDTD